MANAATSNKVIGTSEVTVVQVPSGELANITIQNLSANNVYWGAPGSLSTATGLRISPNGSVEILNRGTPISVIADGASSDVRVDVEFYRVGER